MSARVERQGIKTSTRIQYFVRATTYLWPHDSGCQVSQHIRGIDTLTVDVTMYLPWSPDLYGTVLNRKNLLPLMINVAPVLNRFRNCLFFFFFVFGEKNEAKCKPLLLLHRMNWVIWIFHRGTSCIKSKLASIVLEYFPGWKCFQWNQFFAFNNSYLSEGKLYLLVAQAVIICLSIIHKLKDKI